MQVEDGRDTAGLILDAAREILEKQGYAGLSMRRIAAHVGISQAAIYRHFPDKDGLVRSIAKAGYDRLLASLLAALTEAGGSDERKVAEGIRAYVAFALENPAQFRALLIEDAGPARPGRDSLQPGVALRRKTFELMVSVLRHGAESGSFAPCDPELSAQAVWTSMFGLAARLVLESELTPAHREALIERHIEIIIRGLR
ncbi:MAG: TetR/AcrR family transcriptional regulator [Spirochaetia bacterium]